MMADQEFVKYIVSALVSKPDKVEVERVVDERGVLLTLHVDDEDLGRVIGRKGSTAQSLRTLLRVLGNQNEAHYNLRIADYKNGESADDSRPRSRRKPAAKPADEASEAKASEVSADEQVAAEDDNASDFAVDEQVAAEDDNASDSAADLIQGDKSDDKDEDREDDDIDFADKDEEEDDKDEEEDSSLLDKTKKELDKLDDLDI